MATVPGSPRKEIVPEVKKKVSKNTQWAKLNKSTLIVKVTNSWEAKWFATNNLKYWVFTKSTLWFDCLIHGQIRELPKSPCIHSVIGFLRSFGFSEAMCDSKIKIKYSTKILLIRTSLYTV